MSANLDPIIRLIGTDCTGNAIDHALDLAEAQRKKGGSPSKITDLLPQLLVNGVPDLKLDMGHGDGKDEGKLSCKPDGQVDSRELAAALVAAARIAVRNNIKLEDVPLSEIEQKAPDVYRQLQLQKETVCRAN